MSVISHVVVFFVLCVALYKADDLLLGSTTNGQLGYQETVKLSSVPLKTRTKNVFYNSNNTKIIKGIIATDMDKTSTKPTLTAGGVGSSFVNIRFKSDKGVGLYYLVQIFV